MPPLIAHIAALKLVRMLLGAVRHDFLDQNPCDILPNVGSYTTSEIILSASRTISSGITFKGQDSLYS